jgi:hypothetical protein
MPLILNSPRAMAVRGFVGGVEQVETGIGAAFVLYRPREPAELFTAVAGILDSRQKLQLARLAALRISRSASRL